jgi:transposase-like protein
MKLKCPDSECVSKNSGANFRPYIRKGCFFRKSDGQWISRYRCSICGKYFSSATFNPCFGQKKRKLNYQVYELLNSTVSQRRAALKLGVSRRTIVRKFRFLAEQSRLSHQEWLNSLKPKSIQNIQFDDLETAEHSKCKPLSVSLAIEPRTRKILGFQVSKMPAKGHLVSIALKKYGLRADERPKGWNALFASLKQVAHPKAEWLSDENPHYPRHLKVHHPESVHRTVKGRRGCIVGYEELKKIGFDPLFSLNHTCAMLRANLNRLLRRTWCTTKTMQGLIDHLSIYVAYHNEFLTAKTTIG